MPRSAGFAWINAAICSRRRPVRIESVTWGTGGGGGVRSAVASWSGVIVCRTTKLPAW